MQVEPSVGDVELHQQVARRQGHVGQVGDVPGAHDDTAGVRVVLDGIHRLADLIDVAFRELAGLLVARVAPPLAPTGSRRWGPNSPSSFAHGFPDRRMGRQAVVDVGRAAQEPQKLPQYGVEQHLLGGDEGEALPQVVVRLQPEQRQRLHRRAVGALHAVVQDHGEQGPSRLSSHPSDPHRRTAKHGILHTYIHATRTESAHFSTPLVPRQYGFLR